MAYLQLLTEWRWVFLALFVFVSLRSQIRRLIDRIKSVQGKSFRADFRRQFTGFESGLSGDFASDESGSSADHQEATPALDPARESRIQYLQEQGTSPYVESIKQNALRELEKLELDADSPAVQVLLQQYALAEARLNLVDAYHTLFGSQITLLRWLRSTGGINREEAKGFFERVKIDNAPAYDHIDVDTYLSDLQRTDLIRRGPAGGYHITDKGDDVLDLVHRGRLAEKPG